MEIFLAQLRRVQRGLLLRWGMVNFGPWIIYNIMLWQWRKFSNGR